MSPAGGRVAGVRIDAVDLESAMARIETAIGTGSRIQIATVNLDFLVQAQRSAELRSVLNQSDLNIADGMPVVWLSKLAGRDLPGRTAGSDLVPLALSRLAARHARVFLLGGEGAVAIDAARRLEQIYPGLVVAGHCEPPRASIDRMPNRSIIRLIRHSRPDVLLVALGNPKQELWIARHLQQLDVSVAIGVGCTLDIMAGRVRRAPGWMQKVGLEWLFRLMQEPGRLFRRYAIDSLWLARFVWSAARNRQAPAATSAAA